MVIFCYSHFMNYLTFIISVVAVFIFLKGKACVSLLDMKAAPVHVTV